MAGEKATQLLRRVARRQQARTLGARCHLFLVILAATYLACLLCGRLLGLFPHWFTLPTLLLVPMLALLAGLILTRRPGLTETARLVDERAQTHDLYLTAVLIDHSIGEFKPLVIHSAEDHAETIRPAEVAPFAWRTGTRNAVLVLGVLLLGVLYLPTFDPFGKQEAVKKVAERRKELRDSIRATTMRAELLKKDEPTSELSKDAQQRLDDLKATLNNAKPKEQKANLAALQQNQKELGELWRKDSELKLKDALERVPPQQQFGAASPKATEWKQQLENGNADALNKQLEELHQMAEQLAQAPEGEAKEKLREQMKERMKDMADFMARDANAKQAAAALNRAMDQMAMAGAKGLDKEALKALQKSLKLTEMELNALAQNVRDLKALEEGLKAAQLAKRLNEKGELDGEGAEAAAAAAGKGMEGYAKLYAKMVAQGLAGDGDGEGDGDGNGNGNGRGRGNRGGMGGRGHGQGGVAPEDPSLKTDYSTEQSKSALTAGKILLSWKTQELADPGTARINYMDKIEAVRKGAAEAVLKEQVPPGYQDAISKYFDSMGESVAQPKNP